NASVVHLTYDLDDRLSGKQVTPGPGVSSDTTSESYAYDGMSRLVRAQDDDSTVTRQYDSLSNVVRETQNGRATVSTYDGEGNQTHCTYSGGRVIATTYDALNRPSVSREGDSGAVVVRYFYLGADRVRRRIYGNGAQTDYSYDGA